MIKRIPYILYAIILLIIVSFLGIVLVKYLVDIKWIKGDDGQSKIAIFSAIYTVIGLLLVVFQLQSQKKNELISIEYLNQPLFKLVPFANKIKIDDSIIDKCPKLCSNGERSTNKCIDEHWFNLVQIGKLPASNIRCSMIHVDEDDVRNKSRIKEIGLLINGDDLEYKLSPFEIDSDYFDLTRNSAFFILVSYTSLYSNVKYKKIYRLSYSPTGKVQNNGYWLDSIKFYDVKNEISMDSNSIPLTKILIGRIINILVKLGIKKNLDFNDWSILF